MELRTGRSKQQATYVKPTLKPLRLRTGSFGKFANSVPHGSSKHREPNSSAQANPPLRLGWTKPNIEWNIFGGQWRPLCREVRGPATNDAAQARLRCAGLPFIGPSSSIFLQHITFMNHIRDARRRIACFFPSCVRATGALQCSPSGALPHSTFMRLHRSTFSRVTWRNEGLGARRVHSTHARRRCASTYETAVCRCGSLM
jgi:hypothetical protein